MPGSAMIPCLRYADAPAAIDFLCSAFGFDRHAVYADPEDPTIIHHAQLVLGAGMVMLGSAQPAPTDSLIRWRTARQLGGVTGCIYIVVPDADLHCEQAREKGAVIIRGPQDNDGYPGRGYDALDPEGNVWSFGSYDPWAQTAPPA
jgi:uncharacterized glyoxalase superfamily protein PhnB